MTDYNSFLLMCATSEGPPSQIHLPDGRTLFPIGGAVDPGSGLTTNQFAVPRQFAAAAIAMGLERPSDVQNRQLQGPTSARPNAPADQTGYFDQTLGRFVFWSASAHAWLDRTTLKPS